MVASPLGTKTIRASAPLMSIEKSLEVLIEIVSAELIPSNIKQLNPYCILRRQEDIENNNNIDDGDGDGDGDGGSRKKNRTQRGSSGTDKAKILHQTSIIRQNNSPIWTIRTRSLFLLNLDHEEQELIQDNHEHRNKRVHFQFEIMHRRYTNVGVVVGGADISLGIVTLTLDQLKNGDGSRTEMELQPKMSDKISQKLITKGHIALRYRLAQDHEVRFMEGLESSNSNPNPRSIRNLANLVNFKSIASSIPKLTLQGPKAPNSSRRGIDHANVNVNVPVSTDTIRNNLQDHAVAYAGTPKSSVNSSSHGHDRFSFLQDTASTHKEWNKLKGHHTRNQIRSGKLHKVKPYCDTDNPDTTTWLTKEQFHTKALEPSTHWVEAGEGDLGILQVEVLKCNNLPNYDSGVNGDYTDAFVAMAYEDNIVRTDVVMDELSPHFMPWTQRAFTFPIKHATSLLFLGVFDYDTIGNHDPIGRVVIELSNFKANTVYLLDYALQLQLVDAAAASSASNPSENSSSSSYDTTATSSTNINNASPPSAAASPVPGGLTKNRGTISIRLHFRWHNESQVLFSTFHPPPPFRVNVNSRRAFRVVRYVCRGELDMEKSTMASVKEYAHELMGYFDSYLFMIDAIARILLWRGSIVTTIRNPKLLGKDASPVTVSLWFPLRSIVTFFVVLICIEDPSLIPSMFFFSIGFIMFALMYGTSRYPSPWKQTKKVKDILRGIIFGQEVFHMHINPYDGYNEAVVLDELDKARIDRAKKILFALKTFLLRLRRERQKLDPYHYLIPSKVRNNPFRLNILNFLDPTEYLHLGLSTLCLNLRVIRNIITWKSYHHSFALTMYSFLFGTVLLIAPVDRIIQWSFRISAFLFLGPWMKLVDIYCVIPYYPPPCKETRKLIVKQPNFEKYWESQNYKSLARRIHLAEEKALKLKDMREYRFGTFMEAVPSVDSSRYPSIPEPTSSARPYRHQSESEHELDAEAVPAGEFGYEYLPGPYLKWQRLSAQKLRGDMIPLTSLDISKNQKDMFGF